MFLSIHLDSSFLLFLLVFLQIWVTVVSSLTVFELYVLLRWYHDGGRYAGEYRVIVGVCQVKLGKVSLNPTVTVSTQAGTRCLLRYLNVCIVHMVTTQRCPKGGLRVFPESSVCWSACAIFWWGRDVSSLRAENVWCSDLIFEGNLKANISTYGLVAWTEILDGWQLMGNVLNHVYLHICTWGRILCPKMRLIWNNEVCLRLLRECASLVHAVFPFDEGA